MGDDAAGERQVRALPLLCSHELRGLYRFRDLFQLLPAPAGTPQPPIIIGDYPLLLELAVDSRTCRERSDDIWAHDVKERSRLQELERKLAAKKVKPDERWWNAHAMDNKMRRTPALVQELTRLLSVVTNYSFFQNDSSHTWYMPMRTTGERIRHMLGPLGRVNWLVRFLRLNPVPVWGQTWNPVGPHSTENGFSQALVEPVVSVSFAEYYDRHLGYGPGEAIVDFPDNIDQTLSAYFALAPHPRVAFARACELYGQSTDIWQASKSLSLVALVFAIEALVHANDPSPTRCRACSALVSADRCSTCGAPMFSLTRRFRQFVEDFAPEAGDLRLANRLYEVRSTIAHQGHLLRSDEFDSGFNTGGKDDQRSTEYDARPLARRVLRKWLWYQQPSP